MEFKKIGTSFIDKIQALKKKKKEEKTSFKTSAQESVQKAPNNPNYWQSVTIKKPKNGKQKSARVKGDLETFLPSNQLQALFEEDKEIAKHLIENEFISEEAFREFLNVNVGSKHTESKYIKPFLNILDDAFKNEDNTTGEYFNLLFSPYPKSFSDENLDKRKELLLENDPVKKRILEIGETYINTRCAFYNADQLNSISLFIDEDNIDDLEDYIIENKKDSPNQTRDLFEDIKFYSNPKTSKFDKKLSDLERYFENNPRSKNSYIGVSSEMKRAISSLVDLETGEISQHAVKFVEKFILDTESTGVAKDGKSRATIADEYPSYYYAMSFLKEIMQVAKDKNGNISKHNLNCIEKILKDDEPNCFFYGQDLPAIELMKNENGIIDENKLESALQKRPNFGYSAQAEDYVKGMNILGVEKCSKFYDELKLAFHGGLYSTNTALIPAIRRCFDRNGEFIQEEFDNIIDVGKQLSHVNFTDELLEFISHKENRETIKNVFKNGYNPSSDDIKYLLEIAEKHSDKNGILKPFIKDKMEVNLNKYFRIPVFAPIFEECMADDGNEEAFDEKKFKRLKTFYEKCLQANINVRSGNLATEECLEVLSGKLNPDTLLFCQKIEMASVLQEVLKDNGEDKDFEPYFHLLDKLNSAFSLNKFVMPSSEKDIKEFTSSVLGYSGVKNGELSNFENVMVKSIPLLKTLSGGLPLLYSRKNFIEDLSSTLNTEEKQDAFSKAAGVDLYCDEKTGKILFYDGIIDIEKLDKDSDEYKLCHKFFYENEVQTKDKKFNSEMNKIIKAAPEFLNTVGKKQHGTHKYSLDIHQLLVLAESINNPDYKKLRNIDKIALKSVAIFHDIMKKEDTIDKGHQYTSADSAKQISNKFFNNDSFKDRFFELVKNHHWLELYSKNPKRKDAANEAAFNFRRIGDFEVAKIMARADLKAVSDEFYGYLKNALDKEKISQIEDALVNMYSEGNVIYSDYPISEKMLNNHKETLNGTEYKVINFNEIDDNEDLGKYGFLSGKTKKDAFLLVHMVDDGSKLGMNLNTVKALINSSKQGVLSESLITPKDKVTYCDRKYGLLLSQENVNIICADKWNQGSGAKKSQEDAIHQMFNYNERRELALKKILGNLGIDKEELKKEDVANFYKMLAPKTSILQFSDSKDYLIGNKKIKGKKIKEAIYKYQKQLIVTDKFDSHYINNEVVGYAPKIKGVIAKEKSLKDVPKELLDFADKNNLPIVLI